MTSKLYKFEKSPAGWFVGKWGGTTGITLVPIAKNILALVMRVFYTYAKASVYMV
jgi:hypothetical protein